MADNYEFIICPACGKIMKKVYLEDQDFIVDICLDGCGGIWLDNRELAKVDEKKENITPIEEAKKNRDYIEVNTALERECPICHKPMVKNNVSVKDEITIDECYHCGGKFFDHCELEAMRNQYESDAQRLADIRQLALNSDKMQIILDKMLREDSV